MTTEKIDIEIKSETKDLDILNKKLKQVGDKMNKLKPPTAFQKLKQQQKELNIQLSKTQKTIDKLNLEKQIGPLGNFLNKTSEQFVKFNGNMLSLLFFGMELKRIFGSALTSIFEGYKKIIPETSMFNQATTRLSANWEFFKFQLADAFAKSDLFRIMIEYTINLIQWFQGLSETTKKWIVILLGVGLAFGALTMAVGVWALGIAGVLNILKAFGSPIATINIGLTKLVTLTEAFFASWLLPIAAVILLGIMWKKYVDKYGADIGFMTDSWKDYITIFIGAFINGFSQLLLSLAQVGTVFIDFFMNIGKAAVRFGQGLASVIRAALDPTKTVRDEFTNMFSDIKRMFADPNNYTLTAGLQNLKEKISAETLSITQSIVNASNQAANTTTEPNVQNNIIVDGATIQNNLTEEEKKALNSLLRSANIDIGGLGI